MTPRERRRQTMAAIAKALEDVGWHEPEDAATFAYVLILLVYRYAGEHLNGADLPPLGDSFPWPDLLRLDR